MWYEVFYRLPRTKGKEEKYQEIPESWGKEGNLNEAEVGSREAFAGKEKTDNGSLEQRFSMPKVNTKYSWLLVNKSMLIFCPDRPETQSK